MGAPAAHTYNAATGTGDATAIAVTARLMGVSVGESAGAPAVATVLIRRGSSTGPEVARFELAANASETVWFGPGGIYCPDGIYIDRTAGETVVTVYYV